MPAYNYAIDHVRPANAVKTAPAQNRGYFVAKFSTDGGSTYVPVWPRVFQSYSEAQQALQTLIDNEDDFIEVVQGNRSGKDFPCVVQFFTYPT